MDLEEFIKKVEMEFDEIPPGKLTADINFREIVDWNSINAIMLMALIITEYDVNLDVDELKDIYTLRELYTLISRKMTS